MTIISSALFSRCRPRGDDPTEVIFERACDCDFSAINVPKNLISHLTMAIGTANKDMIFKHKSCVEKVDLMIFEISLSFALVPAESSDLPDQSVVLLAHHFGRSQNS
jgi:hypothetical protein